METLSNTSTSNLLRELLSNGTLLMKRQLKLAQIEARRDGKKEKTSLELLAVAGVIGHAAILFCLVAVSLVISEALGRLWAGPVIIAGALLLMAGVLASIGWFRRVRTPLQRTRHELNKERSWATHQLTT